MNNQPENDPESLKALLLLSELEKGEAASQREIAGRLGIALGLVNVFLKKLVNKGFVTVKTYPRNRYVYLLTPKGFAEKSRLALSQVGLFNKIFQVTRQESLVLFEDLKRRGCSSVVFVGHDEFTEIAYLSLVEAGLKLTYIISDRREEDFFSAPACTFAEVQDNVNFLQQMFILTSFRDFEAWRKELLEAGVNSENIVPVHQGVTQR